MERHFANIISTSMVRDILLGLLGEQLYKINALRPLVYCAGKGYPIGVTQSIPGLYLASNDAKYVTGIELNVDGGILAGSTAAPSSQ
jgi:3(or 17)beta-hydroxysteroid dehydrogenase